MVSKRNFSKREGVRQGFVWSVADIAANLDWERVSHSTLRGRSFSFTPKTPQDELL